METSRPADSQISELIQRIRGDENLIQHWSMDYDDWWLAMNNLASTRQYKYLLALWFNGKYIELNNLLERLGLPRKKETNICEK
jgi:hypothetical protein